MEKLLGSSKSKITTDKNGENVLNLEISEAELLCCNVINKAYRRGSRVLSTLVPNKLFGQLLNISFKNFIFFKTFNSEVSYNEV